MLDEALFTRRAGEGYGAGKKLVNKFPHFIYCEQSASFDSGISGQGRCQSFAFIQLHLYIIAVLIEQITDQYLFWNLLVEISRYSVNNEGISAEERNFKSQRIDIIEDIPQ
jgi:hypothetical protein